MSKPKIFIGSSTEGLHVAKAILRNLDQDGEITIWNQGVFKLSVPIITSLVKALNNFDFAIFVFSPDDLTNVRGELQNTVRDNVIFETGLFIGRLGTEKVYFVKPQGQSLRLPSDLLGVVPGDYDSKRSDKNWMAATLNFCEEFKTEMLKKSKKKHKPNDGMKHIISDLSPTYKAIILDLTTTHISLLLAINDAGEFQCGSQIKNTLRGLRDKGLLYHNNTSIASCDKVWLTALGKKLANALENAKSNEKLPK